MKNYATTSSSSEFLIAFFITCLFIAVGNSAIFSIILFAILSCFSFLWAINNPVEKKSLFCIGIILFCFLISLLGGHVDSMLYLMVSIKPLFYLLMPFSFAYIFYKLNVDVDNILEIVFKFITISALCVAVLGFFVGSSRDTGFLGLSIYLSYSISILLFVIYHNLDRLWLLAALIAVFFLGSKTGLLVYMIVIILSANNLRTKWLISLFGIPIALIGVYYYSIYFRGQNILDFQNLDRFLLLEGALNFVINNFNVHNYLFGFGLGRSVLGFETSSLAFNNWIYMSFATEGLYSFIFHNEFVRLLFDYGLLGVVSFIFYFLNRKYWHILFLCMITNSVVYVSSIIFILGIIDSKKYLADE